MTSVTVVRSPMLGQKAGCFGPHHTLRRLDSRLAEETGVEAFRQRNFASNFRIFTDTYVAEVKSYVERVGSDLSTSIIQGFDRIITSKGFDESNVEYQQLVRMWSLLKGKGGEAFTLNLSWDWTICQGNARGDGSDPDACELPPRETTTAASSSPTQTSPTQTDGTTAPPSTAAPSPTDAPCGSEQCSTMDCPDGQAAECRALPMGRGHACQCPPRTWTETYPQPTSTRPPCGSEDCLTIDCPDGQAGECWTLPMGRGHACQCLPRTWTETHPTPSPTITSADETTEVPSKPTPTVRWTQNCIVSAARFDKTKALKWADELCKDADKNKWSHEWFLFDKNNRRETKGLKVQTEEGEELKNYLVAVEANKPRDVARYCDGGTADIASGLEALRKDPELCKKNFRELLDSWKNSEKFSAGGERRGLCLEWVMTARP
ncbi:hypothetical protein CMUS01_16145 [Colletotrichum musicola]|uniref:Uncharacterized protein n=1 Tax=Colletotrichum musicola TaxID=2175873 RepID=A0A8H6MJP9_9PEZI|nr:hypothetical protein CMUS01_16145 [Colletotrichum musicola]